MQAVGRADTDRKDRRSFAARPAGAARDGRRPGRIRAAGVASVGEQDDSGDALPAIAIADGIERAGDVGSAAVRAEMIDAAFTNRRERLADREALGDEAPLDCRQELRAEHGLRPRQPRLAIGVVDAHAARRVDQNRHDGVARAGRRQHGDGPEQKQHERREREHAEADQHGALAR